MDFNSPLLKEMPKSPVQKKSRVPKRAIIISGIALFIAIPFVVVSTRLLPADGAGIPFYWFHDNIYLPLKAYTFSLFYPYSLGWWGPILTAFVIWLIAYLTRSVIIRNPHTYMLKRVVRRRSKHRFLVKSSRWLKRKKFDPVLMREVTSAEREKTLVQYIAAGLDKVDEPLTRRLTALTGFHTRLLTLPPADVKDHFEAAVIWHRTYLHVRARAQFHPGNKTLEDQAAELARMLEFILPALMDFTDPVKLKNALHQKSGFDLPGLALDLLYLSSLHNPEIAEALVGSTIAANPAALQKAVIARLADSIEFRSALLERIHYHLEANDIIDQTMFPYLSEMQDAPQLLQNAGKLSLSISLDLAVLAQSVPVAIGNMETMEVLDFILQHRFPNEDPQENLFITEIKTVAQVPDRGFYRLCAELSEKELNLHRDAWKQSVLRDRGPIIPADFQLAETRIRALYHAAGPELDKP